MLIFYPLSIPLMNSSGKIIVYSYLIGNKGVNAQKMKFPIKDIFSKCDQIRWKLWIWSQLLKKSFMENFIFCAVHI